LDITSIIIVTIIMVDADEDAMPRMGTGGEDTDLSDETQDFRFLSIIS
jgi:tRNA-splicing endonuclease subunit Sen54